VGGGGGYKRGHKFINGLGKDGEGGAERVQVDSE
jgi:hypothetical protein